jgi:HNH endonuclease
MGVPAPGVNVMRDFNGSIVEVSMASSSKVLRHRAALHQRFRCYYCRLLIWIEDPNGFAARHKLTTVQTRLLRCTAEHLRARGDGGSNRRDNVVAACFYCNSRRHRMRNPLSPPEYQARVRRRMREGRWLAADLPRDFLRM